MTLEKTEVYCGLGNTRQHQMPGFHWEEAEKFVKLTAKYIALLSIIFIFFSTNALLLSQDVKLIEKIEFSTETELPSPGVYGFCVTDDELVIIPDYEAGNVKIYEKNGELLELVKIIGRKGYGPGEFSRPTHSFYNKEESRFVVMDHGIRKIFIYDRVGRIEFKRVKEIACWRGAFDIKLIGDKLFISGYASDPNKMHYDFYYIDLTNDKTTYLLPSYIKFGLKSNREFEIQFLEKYEILAIGVQSWFDIHKDDAYFLWEGRLKVIKLNIVSPEIEANPFGMQPPHYIKPYASSKLLEGFNKDDSNLIQIERAKRSYGRNILVNSKYVIIIYEGPVNPENASILRIQFYTLDGDFIKEESILNSPTHIWFDKNKAILYFLSRKMGENGYYILKYGINE